jgi:hypothetical protein
MLSRLSLNFFPASIRLLPMPIYKTGGASDQTDDAAIEARDRNITGT